MMSNSEQDTPPMNLYIKGDTGVMAFGVLLTKAEITFNL